MNIPKLLFLFPSLWSIFFQSFSIGLLLGDEPQQRLLHHLFHRYDRRIRPPSIGEGGVANIGHHRPTSVKVLATIVLGILIEMRENEQVAAYVISHIQRWQDKRLCWNPSEHGNITELIVPHKMLWQPKMFVYNSMDTKEMLDDEKNDVRLRWDGHIKVNIPQFVTCTCRLGIEKFPFDTQFCAVAFASPLLTVQEMEVNSTQPPKDSYFAGNSEWNLINVSVKDMHYLEEGEYRAEVHYVFHLRRRPIFYITVVVIPIFLISMLSLLGIFTPGSSNDGPRSEKVSLGLGSLLAMTVLLGIVAGAMPKSNSIPLLGYYILSVILLCAIAVAVSMAFMTAAKRYVDNVRIPSSFVYRIAFVRPKLRSMVKKANLVGTVARQQREKEMVHRTKSITHQILSLRLSEIYQPMDEGDQRRKSNSNPDRPSICQEYGSNDSDYGSEHRNGHCGGGRKLIGTHGRSAVQWSNTNGNLLGGELALLHGEQQNEGGGGGGGGDEDGGSSECWDRSSETARLSAEIGRIRTLLSVVVESQREFRAKLERERVREQIEHEWSRIFVKMDYLCLTIFQLLNLFSLLFFLRFAWSESPKEPDRPLV